jgi:glycosyltransferase involved in cell wall biosynthesis
MVPSISVVMPVYNAQDFLSEAIQSVLDQTFTDFECIILNDGSTDRSVEIIKSFEDPRIRVVDNDQNIKIVRTLNKGISLAKGKYIVRMDADDICLPERFKTQFTFMEENPEVGACGSWFENFGEMTGIARYEADHNELRFKMLYQMPILHPSTIIRKEILEKNNLNYDINYLQGEDYDFFARIAEVSKVANIPKVLLKYRQHSNSGKTINNDVLAQCVQKIIITQFNKIGVQISIGEMDLFSRFCNSDFNLSIEDTNNIEMFLLEMIKANSNTNYLNHNHLTRILSEKWFSHCYNLSRKNGLKMYKKYFASGLSEFYKPSIIFHIKFIFRSIFNVKITGCFANYKH